VSARTPNRGGASDGPLSHAARSLINAAGRHELGLDFVLQGYPESVAAIHGVHADAVHEARSFLAESGHEVGGVPEESPPFRSTRPPAHGPDGESRRGGV